MVSFCFVEAQALGSFKGGQPSRYQELSCQGRSGRDGCVPAVSHDWPGPLLVLGRGRGEVGPEKRGLCPFSSEAEAALVNSFWRVMCCQTNASNCPYRSPSWRGGRRREEPAGFNGFLAWGHLEKESCHGSMQRAYPRQWFGGSGLAQARSDC